MHEWTPILVMMNNYFHDVATALLATSAAAAWGLRAALVRGGLSPDHPAARIIYRALTRTALLALAWIVLGGIPRTIYFTRYEWWDAASKGIVGALVIKHLVMFIMVAGGAALWADIRRRLPPNPPGGGDAEGGGR